MNFQPQGRNTRTYQYSDTANLMVGNHALQFGGSMEQIRVNAYNFAARFPTRDVRAQLGGPSGRRRSPPRSSPGSPPRT